MVNQRRSVFQFELEDAAAMSAKSLSALRMRSMNSPGGSASGFSQRGKSL
jgi:hypothetical protein